MNAILRKPSPVAVPAPARDADDAAILARAGHLEVRLARSAGDVEAAQRLRWRVFAEEMGARLDSPDGLDADAFDPHCEHLLVVDRDAGTVVGTYRILFPEAAARVGRFYSETEFDLSALAPIRHQLVELGRSCVHPDYRSGGVIMLLWSGIGELVSRHDHRYLIGCVSVPMRDDGSYAASLWRRLARRQLAGPSLRVTPRDRLPVETLVHDLDVVVPPLVKGYVRLGAQLLGEPHRDVDFGVADFPMMLPIAAIDPRYGKRFTSPCAT